MLLPVTSQHMSHVFVMWGSCLQSVFSVSELTMCIAYICICHMEMEPLGFFTFLQSHKMQGWSKSLFLCTRWPINANLCLAFTRSLFHGCGSVVSEVFHPETLRKCLECFQWAEKEFSWRATFYSLCHVKYSELLVSTEQALVKQ